MPSKVFEGNRLMLVSEVEIVVQFLGAIPVSDKNQAYQVFMN